MTTTPIPAFVKNQALIHWVEEMATLCQPDSIHWCDGSQDEYDALCERLIAGGAPGIHFYTMNQSVATLEICRRLFG